MKKSILFLFALLQLASASAQTGTYGCTFSNPQIVNVAGSAKLRVTINMVAGVPFSVGNTNFRFYYNSTALGIPQVYADAFGANFSTTTNTGSGGGSGSNAIGSINTSYNTIALANANNIPIGATPVPLVTIEFPILNQKTTTNLTFIQSGNPKTTVLDDDKTTTLIPVANLFQSLTNLPLSVSAYAGEDVTVSCTNTTKTLNALCLNATSYLWSTGATTASVNVSPSVTTTYSVTVTNSSGVVTNDDVVVNINFSPPMITTGLDKTVTCTTPTATLSSINGSAYLWSNGATTQSINESPTVTTTYRVTIATTSIGVCNSVIDEMKITAIKSVPMLYAPNDKITCVNSSVDLSIIGATGGSYSWSTGATTASINVSPTVTTTYSVSATGANGCVSPIYTVTITIDKTTPIANAGPDITITNCSNPSAELTATGGASYLWSGGINFQTINTYCTVTTTYTVTVTGVNGCTAVDDVVVAVNTVNCPAVTRLSAKVFLVNVNTSTGLMDNYYAADYINNNFPLSEPYTSLWDNYYTHVNNLPTPISPSVLATTGNNAIVDWVFIELRSGATPDVSYVVYTKEALLQRDGDIVSTDGVKQFIEFPNAPAGNYFIKIRHHNHLGILTDNKIALSNSIAQLNFSNNTVALFGGSSTMATTWPISSFWTLIPGDENSDGSVDSIDSGIWEIQNGNFGSYSDNADYNLDGSVDGVDAALWELNNGRYEP